MTANAEIITPLTTHRILVLTGTAALLATLILLVGVLPAEYGLDPTGLGRRTGIADIWQPPQIVVAAPKTRAVPTARSTTTAYREDVIEIPLKSGEDPTGGADVEYKVHMKAGDSLVYSWSVPGIANPEEFYTEFHGHTVENGKAVKVTFYRKATGTSDQGMLSAPFEGVHGWFFQNQAVPPVRLKLKLAGFYTLIPPGQIGNEARLMPVGNKAVGRP
jgi:hypothetical protein